MRIKKEHLILILIFLFGIVFRILKFGDSIVGTDVVLFSRLGKNLIEYGRYAFGENYNLGVYIPPGYPLFIGLINLFINNLFVSAKLISLISSCLTIFLFYLIGKELYDEESGLFAALVYAIFPTILIFSVVAYSEVLFFCFLFLSIYLFIISLKKDNLSMYILFGIFSAISYLTKPEGMLLLLLPSLQVFGFFNDGLFKQRYLLRCLVVLTVFIMVISPYMIFLKNYTGKFTLSGKSNMSILLGEIGAGEEYQKVVAATDSPHYKTLFTLNEEKDQLVVWDKKRNRSLKDYIFKDPVSFAGKYQRNVLIEIKYLIKLLSLIILPLFLSFSNKELFKKRTRLIFILFSFLYFVIYPLFIIVERQILIIVLFLILFSSGGFSNSESAISDVLNYYGIRQNKPLSFIRRNIKPIIVLILAISSLSYLKYSSIRKAPDPIEHIKAGYFLKNNISPKYEKLNVMSVKPLVCFYSGSRFTMLPYANSADVINFARLYNVDYIVIDERTLSKWDFYDELIEMQKYSNKVKLVYEDNSEKLIRLFRVIK